MAASARVLERAPTRAPAHPPRGAPPWLIWTMTFLSGLVVAGLYLDGWAHNNRRLDLSVFPSLDISRSYLPPGIPSTLTVWHAPFFAGVLLAVGVLVITAVRNRPQPAGWRTALPAAYGWSLGGVFLMIIGSVADLLWPTPVRAEMEVLASLFSPPHLLQILGVALLVTAPLRSAWLTSSRGSPRDWRLHLPVVLSMAFALSVLTYITQFVHPFLSPWADSGLSLAAVHRYHPASRFNQGESLGVLSFVVQTALLMGLILPAVRRRLLPPGSLTVIFTLNAVLMSTLQSRYVFIPPAAAAGLISDVMLKQLGTSAREWEFRLFAFAVPVVYCLLYFAALRYLTVLDALWGPIPREIFGLRGLGWSPHLWVGMTLAAGMIGWVLSYLVTPSSIAEAWNREDDPSQEAGRG